MSLFTDSSINLGPAWDPKRPKIEAALARYGRWANLRIMDKSKHADDYHEFGNMPRERFPYKWINYPYGIWVKLRYDLNSQRTLEELTQAGIYAYGTNLIMCPLLLEGNIVVNQFTGTPSITLPSRVSEHITSSATGVPIKSNDVIIIPDYWEIYPPEDLRLDGLDIHDVLVVRNAHVEHIEGPVMWLIGAETEDAR